MHTQHAHALRFGGKTHSMSDTGAAMSAPSGLAGQGEACGIRGFECKRVALGALIARFLGVAQNSSNADSCLDQSMDRVQVETLSASHLMCTPGGVQPGNS